MTDLEIQPVSGRSRYCRLVSGVETETRGVAYEVPEFDCHVIDAPEAFHECDFAEGAGVDR